MFSGRVTTTTTGVRLHMTFERGKSHHVDLISDGAEWWLAEDDGRKLRPRWLSREAALEAVICHWAARMAVAA